MKHTISSISSTIVGDFSGFIDGGLKRFQNLDYSARRLAFRHGFSGKLDGNIKKQAAQLGQCLRLASEYSAAARTSTLATKPVLLYYSILNFALAEVLAKQDGNSSLDRARGEHSHHGLEIAFQSEMTGKTGVIEALAFLRARPHIKKTGSAGTFALWHRTSRDYPVIGKVTSSDKSTSYATVLSATSMQLPNFPEKGLHLGACLQLVPTLHAQLLRSKIRSYYCRAAISTEVLDDGSQFLNFIMHPDEAKKIDQAASLIQFSPCLVPDINVREHASGFSLRLSLNRDRPHNISFPSMASISTDDVRVCCIESPLNEFGAFYVSFFILSNLCRYFPDIWIPNADGHSELALLVEALCEEFYRRVPALILGELEGHLFVPAS